MKIKEIRELSPKDLAARKHELREESFHLRIQQQSGQLEKPSTSARSAAKSPARNGADRKEQAAAAANRSRRRKPSPRSKP
jgi:large subunit ribosomal protein L29